MLHTNGKEPGEAISDSLIKERGPQGSGRDPGLRLTLNTDGKKAIFSWLQQESRKGWVTGKPGGLVAGSWGN